jgi:hypothetical protein
MQQANLLVAHNVEFDRGIRHLLKLPARRGDAELERSQPRSAVSTTSHTLHRKEASGWRFAAQVLGDFRRWQSEAYPRT